jgi:hypothetical protein
LTLAGLRVAGSCRHLSVVLGVGLGRRPHSLSMVLLTSGVPLSLGMSGLRQRGRSTDLLDDFDGRCEMPRRRTPPPGEGDGTKGVESESTSVLGTSPCAAGSAPSTCQSHPTTTQTTSM